VDCLEDTKFCDQNTFEIFRVIEKTLASSSVATAGARNNNLDLSEALNTIIEITVHVPSQRLNPNPMREAYLLSMVTLERWVSGTHRDLRQLEAEFIEALYKLAAAVIGGCLGRYGASSVNLCEEQRLAQLDQLITRGAS
jgi:hypothetical protein